MKIQLLKIIIDIRILSLICATILIVTTNTEGRLTGTVSVNHRCYYEGCNTIREESKRSLLSLGLYHAPDEPGT